MPASTYRLQIREQFDLNAAAELTDYLHDLGVDWVYLSPILQAAAGSDHGYDVVDHALVDRARGGRAGLDALSEAAHRLEMGVLVDIVPNHVGVAVPKENAWWWDLLKYGRGSRYAEAFDVDWEVSGGRIRVPVLSEGSTLRIIDGELDHAGMRFPLAPGSNDDDARPDVVHSRQHYELVHWRRADAELNYRRFFAVNTLAGIRLEADWVFNESHVEIARWFAEGLVDGLRVDHPDGLLDPGAYLDRLAGITGGAFVLVEKILESGEILPPHWRTEGTTGYDALGDIERVLVDPAGQPKLDRLDARLHDEPARSWADLIHDSKRAVADGILRSEILRIARLVPSIPNAADAIAEVTACFPVYRSYLPFGAEHLTDALSEAKRRRPDLARELALLGAVLGDTGHPAAMRLQQTTGMVMAKGVEDTAFYRYSRLSSLTEVGGDPSEFSIDLATFHARQEYRQATFPGSMTTLTTHDTKRGEDVRARIDVLSEVPAEWGVTLGTLRTLAPLDDGPLENLLWESIIGAWPASRERLHAYAEKAAREAGTSTSWTDPDEEFERRLHALVDAAFDDTEAHDIIDRFVERIADFGWSNSLAAKLIQLTGPGVPDVYQGSEFWETSLVDPDNRRAVDFSARRDALASIDSGVRPRVDDTGYAKLLVTSSALRLRRNRPELFTRYVPLSAVGNEANHVIAFDRGGAITVATRLPLTLDAAGGWDGTELLLPSHPMVDVLTGTAFEGGTVLVRELLSEYPIALLAVES